MKIRGTNTRCICLLVSLLISTAAFYAAASFGQTSSNAASPQEKNQLNPKLPKNADDKKGHAQSRQRVQILQHSQLDLRAAIGDKINLKVEAKGKNLRYSWIHKKRPLCKSTNCQIDTSNWKIGTHKIYMVIRHKKKYANVLRYVLELAPEAELATELTPKLVAYSNPVDTQLNEHQLHAKSLRGYGVSVSGNAKKIIASEPALIDTPAMLATTRSGIIRFHNEETCQIFALPATQLEFKNEPDKKMGVHLVRGSLRVACNKKPDPLVDEADNDETSVDEGSEKIDSSKTNQGSATTVHALELVTAENLNETPPTKPVRMIKDYPMSKQQLTTLDLADRINSSKEVKKMEQELLTLEWEDDRRPVYGDFLLKGLPDNHPYVIKHSDWLAIAYVAPVDLTLTRAKGSEDVSVTLLGGSIKVIQRHPERPREFLSRRYGGVSHFTLGQGKFPTQYFGGLRRDLVAFKEAAPLQLEPPEPEEEKPPLPELPDEYYELMLLSEFLSAAPAKDRGSKNLGSENPGSENQDNQSAEAIAKEALDGKARYAAKDPVETILDKITGRLLDNSFSIRTGAFSYKQSGTFKDSGQTTSFTNGNKNFLSTFSLLRGEFVHHSSRKLAPVFGFQYVHDFEAERFRYFSGFGGMRYYFHGAYPERLAQLRGVDQPYQKYRPYADVSLHIGQYLIAQTLNDTAVFATDFYGLGITGGYLIHMSQTYAIDANLGVEYDYGVGRLEFSALNILLSFGVTHFF